MRASSLTALLLALAWVGTGCGLVDTIQARQAARDGNALYMAGDYRGAIAKYKEAQALDPETPNLYLNLGYAFFSAYDPESDKPEDRQAAREAVAAFEEHLKRVPDDEKARVFEIKTLLKAAPSDKQMADEALKTFLGMLAKNPKDHEARQYLITLFIDCQRYEDSVEFFGKELAAKPDDVETMKILAIIADKAKRTQDAVEWYWKRAELAADQEKKALMYYEVGTYLWTLLHYQPERHKGVEAIRLADQGIEACRRAMGLKDKYAEAMVYANLLYLKRGANTSDPNAMFNDNAQAFELRKAAGAILAERKKEQAGPGGAAAPEGAPAPGAAPAAAGGAG